MEERNLSSWREFKDELLALRDEHEKLRAGDSAPMLFRGQSNACWLLKTTLDRKRDGMLIQATIELSTDLDRK